MHLTYYWSPKGQLLQKKQKKHNLKSHLHIANTNYITQQDKDVINMAQNPTDKSLDAMEKNTEQHFYFCCFKFVLIIHFVFLDY